MCVTYCHGTFIASYFKENILILVRLSHKDLQMKNSKTRLCCKESKISYTHAPWSLQIL